MEEDGVEDDLDGGWLEIGITSFGLFVSFVSFGLFSSFPNKIFDIELATELIVDVVSLVAGDGSIVLFNVLALFGSVFINEEFSETLISSSSSENKIPESSIPIVSSSLSSSS